MALAFDAKSDSDGYTNAASVTWSHTCTGSNLGLVVGDGGWHPSGHTVSGVTYNAVALTARATSALSGGDDQASCWTLINPASGANNVVVSITNGGSGDAGGTVATSFTGAHQTTMHADATTATGNDGTPTITIPNNTTADACFDVVAAGSGADPAMTARTNRTEIDSQADGGEGWGGSYLIPAPSGNQVMGWTATSGNWANAGIRVLAAAAAATTTHFLGLLGAGV